MRHGEGSLLQARGSMQVFRRESSDALHDSAASNVRIF